jgi:WD40 repeat protein
MRSLKMLVGGTGMTVKSNKNEVFDDQKGQIDLNQIKLSIPSASVHSNHKRNRSGKYALLQTDEAKKHQLDDNNMSMGELEHDDDQYESYAKPRKEVVEDMQPKYLKGNMVKNIFEMTYSKEQQPPSGANPPPANVRSAAVVNPDFNLKKEKVGYRNFGCTFVIRNAHSERINCLCYLVNGTFVTGSQDKFVRVWSPLDTKPLGNLEEDFPVTLMLRMGKTQQ